MNSAETKLDTRDHTPDSRQPESRSARDKHRPNSSVLRLVRGALDGVGDERSTVELDKDALVKVATELRRLGMMLDEDRLWSVDHDLGQGGVIQQRGYRLEGPGRSGLCRAGASGRRRDHGPSVAVAVRNHIGRMALFGGLFSGLDRNNSGGGHR